MGHFFNAYRRLPGWISALLYLILVLPVFCQAAVPSAAVRLAAGSTDQQYQALKKYFSNLDKDDAQRGKRDSWLKGVQGFQRIFHAERKGLLGPPSLFMMARMHSRMFELFAQEVDLNSARDLFLELADLYPGHYLADDALFSAADLSERTPGDTAQAKTLLEKIVAQYPESDHYQRAKNRLNPQEKESPPATGIARLPSPPSTPTPSPGTPPSPPSPPPTPSGGLSTVAPATFWASKDYTRVVIPAARPVSFTSGLLDNSAAPQHRLYVELKESTIAPRNLRTIKLNQGLLKAVQSSQPDEQTVRLTMELNSLYDYKVFTLKDPFRIVVDLYGAASDTQGEIAQPTADSPRLSAKSQETGADAQAIEEAIISLTDQKKRSPEAPAIASSATVHAAGGEKLSLAQQLGLGVRKIVIDPGHGGKDPGAMAFGLKEKDIVLAVSKKIAKKLRKSSHYEVVLTRSRDQFLSLEERTAVANAIKSDLFISIHVNAHSDKTAGGVETYYLNLATDADAMRVAALENATSNHSIGELQEILANLMNNSKIDESSRLAQFVQTNLIAGLNRKFGTRNLGVKQAPFYVLIGAQMPAILAEISFITNPEEAKLLQSEEYLDRIADQIAAGIVAYVEHQHSAAIRF